MANTVDVKSTVGLLVRRWRHEQGLSVTEVAARADMSHSYLTQIEVGRSVPTETMIKKLAIAFGVPAGVLLGDIYAPVIPESLIKWAEIDKIPLSEAQMLASIEYYGRKPTKVTEWRAIYNFIKAVLLAGDEDEEGAL